MTSTNEDLALCDDCLSRAHVLATWNGEAVCCACFAARRRSGREEAHDASSTQGMRRDSNGTLRPYRRD